MFVWVNEECSHTKDILFWYQRVCILSRKFKNYYLENTCFFNFLIFLNYTGDLIPAIYIVGSKAKQGSSRGFSAREWPINGGLDTGTESCSYTELVITGHADGSIRFWDGSSTTMQALYKIKTSKFLKSLTIISEYSDVCK